MRHHITTPTKHSPELLAHELGHASLRSTPLKHRLWQFGRHLPFAGLLGSVYMSSNDPNSTAAKWAPAAYMASWAPTLAEEGLASYRGLKALPKVQPGHLKSLARGFSGYGVAAALPTLGLHIANRLQQREPSK